MAGRLEGRVALVTGASRGIGRAVARRFAAEGAEVIAVARTQGALEELDDEVRSSGGKLVLAPQDLRQYDKLEQMAGGVFQRWGRLDILVGNAGAIGGGLTPVGHYDLKHFSEAVDTNLTANWALIRAFDPLLRQSPSGRAMFVTAGQARHPAPYWGAYAASKAGLEAMVLCWAAEVGRITNLKVNLIDPGIVATRMREQAFPGEDQSTLTQPDQVTDAFVTLAEATCERHGEIVAAQVNPGS
ncbi:MAG: SDR family NAD(P)-dependent oxidoreductase [Actinomycetota bacterium]